MISVTCVLAQTLYLDMGEHQSIREGAAGTWATLNQHCPSVLSPTARHAQMAAARKGKVTYTSRNVALNLSFSYFNGQKPSPTVAGNRDQPFNPSQCRESREKTDVKINRRQENPASRTVVMYLWGGRPPGPHPWALLSALGQRFPGHPVATSPAGFLTPPGTEYTSF